jgi:hypothetical protein
MFFMCTWCISAQYPLGRAVLNNEKTTWYLCEKAGCASAMGSTGLADNG